MTIRDLVKNYLLADSTVGSLISTRLYPNLLPQKVTYPAAVITAVDIVRPPTLRKVAGLAKARIQLDVYAQPASGQSSRAVADQVGAAIRRRLDGFGWKSGADTTLTDTTTSPHVDVRAWITADPETEGVEEEIHDGLSRHTADYLVDYQTQGGLY
jgi:hypothetical protein